MAVGVFLVEADDDGLLAEGADGDDDLLEAYERASLALSGTVRGVPQRWNDAPDRRLDEVLDALATAVERVHASVVPRLELVEDYIEETHRGDGPALFLAD